MAMKILEASESVGFNKNNHNLSKQMLNKNIYEL